MELRILPEVPPYRVEVLDLALFTHMAPQTRIGGWLLELHQAQALCHRYPRFPPLLR